MVIVCNNGLGHLKRVLSVIQEIIKTEAFLSFDIYVDLKKLQYFSVELNRIRKFQVKFIHYSAGIKEYEKGFIRRFKEKIERADFVWSDNLSFPVVYNQRFAITGSFLWSQIYDKSFRITEEFRIKKYKPVMIGTNLFSTPQVKKNTDYSGVGLYRYTDVNIESKEPESLLISCGKSQNGLTYFSKKLDEIARLTEKYLKDIPIYLEPDLYNILEDKDNFIKATFLPEMYDKIRVAIVRPGLGTISELWSRRIKIFPIFEKDNQELIRNAKIIRNIQGDKVQLDISKLMYHVSAYFHDKDSYCECKNKLESLKFNGIEKTAEILIKNIYQS